MTHELKTWPTYFEAVRDGRKTFEVREDDRDFNEGDTLILREYVMGHTFDYTGRALKCDVTYCFRNSDMGVSVGFVVMAIQNVQEYYPDPVALLQQAGLVENVIDKGTHIEMDLKL